MGGGWSGMSGRRLDASALRDWAHTAVGDLIAHTDEINRLNVFPVADADTGTNMLFTMRAALGAGGRVCRRRRRDAGWPRRWPTARCTARGATPGSSCRRSCAAWPTSPREAAAERGGELADIDGAVLAAALRHAVGLVVASMGEIGAGHHRVGAAGRRRSGRGRRAADGADLAGGGARRVGRRGRSRWTRPPSSSTCSPMRAWSTPVVAGCWCCSTRCPRR